MADSHTGGLLVGHCSRAGIDSVIRGARGVPDLAYEMPMTRISCTSVTAMSRQDGTADRSRAAPSHFAFDARISCARVRR